MKLIILATLLCLTMPVVHAETFGRGSGQDKRVQTATYSEDNVYRIYAVKNRLTSIQLQPGETINSDKGVMGAGQPKDWIIGASKDGSFIILKPSEYATEPDTNIIINTNKRTYLFELKLTDNVNSMTYLMRFNYPAPPKIGDTPFKGKEININPCDGNINRAWQKRGDLAISAYEIWDNGTLTCMRFPTNAPLPAIYEVLPDGTEAQVNRHPVNDIVVIHSVSKVFRLRLNKLVLEYRTKANNTGWYNYNGTTTGEIREVKP